MEQIASRIALIRGLSDRLRVFLAGLPQEEWTRPSACDLWEVRDVVAHVTSGAGRQIDSMRRGLAGDCSPPPGFESVDLNSLSASNVKRDIALRKELGEQLLPAFVARHEELTGLLDGFSAAGWDTPCWHARKGTMPAEEYVDLRVQELAIHDWDIRSGLDAGARLDPESVPVLQGIALSWLRASFRPGPPLDAPAVFRFEVTAQAALTHDVAVKGDSFQAAPAGGSKADVVVRCDADSYLLYLYGRLTAAAGVAAGRLSVAGDASRLQRFEEWFKGF
jgi:uncharacterized protein (TIGR03083 family)